MLDDPVDTLALALASEGLEVRRWWRRGFAGRRATGWPEGGPCGTVALRLPRAKDELEMMVHAAAGLLDPAGRFLVYGAKDEGAGSAARLVERVFESVSSVATGNRCRLLQASGVRADVALRPRLDHWCRTFDPGVPGLSHRWASFPGVFAHGRLDGGTRLLMDVLPSDVPASHILDFGCGHGILGAAVASRSAGARVVFLDVDAVALAAVRRNVPGATTVLSDGWTDAPDGEWGLVVSNPPYHQGKGETLRILDDLVTGAARRLAVSGALALVVQRRLPTGGLLRSRFATVEILGDAGPWRAWRATNPRTG